MRIYKTLYRTFLIFLLVVCVPTYSQQLKTKGLPTDARRQLDNFTVLLNRYKAEGNMVQEADYLNKIAYIFWENGSTEEAVEFFIQSIEINKKIGNDNALQAIYTNIGTIYFDEGFYNEALKYFRLSYDINRKNGKKKNSCSNQINIALCYGSVKQYNDAIDILIKALDNASELNDLKLMKTCLGMLYEYYENIGNSEKSIQYFNQFSALDKKFQREEMKEMEKITEIARTEKNITEQILRKTVDTLKEVSQIAEYQQQQIILLNREKELQQKEQELIVRERAAEKKVYRLIIISTISGILLLAIILIIIFINYKKNKKINAILEKQNKEISDQRDIIESANKNITNSINYAKRIQKALLPPADSISNLVPESFIYFKPRDIVSGDFYWFSKTKVQTVIFNINDIEKVENARPVKVKDGTIVAAIDCTGHGVPGAFMSMIGYNLLHEIISLGIIEPDEILNQLNTGIRNQLKQQETENHDGMDMALCLINSEMNEVTFAGAKNPLVYIQNGEIKIIKGDFLPVGGFINDYDQRKYTKHVVNVDKPTSFYIFSDGFSDQIGGSEGRKFLTRYFREYLLEISSHPMNEQKGLLERKFKEWVGNKFAQIDDILIIGFKLYPLKF